MQFFLREAITPGFVPLLLAILAGQLGARAISERSNKWEQGTTADLHWRMIYLMRLAIRHVTSFLESPLTDMEKLLKILQTLSKSP